MLTGITSSSSSSLMVISFISSQGSFSLSFAEESDSLSIYPISLSGLECLTFRADMGYFWHDTG